MNVLYTFTQKNLWIRAMCARTKNYLFTIVFWFWNKRKETFFFLISKSECWMSRVCERVRIPSFSLLGFNLEDDKKRRRAKPIFSLFISLSVPNCCVLNEREILFFIHLQGRPHLPSNDKIEFQFWKELVTLKFGWPNSIEIFLDLSDKNRNLSLF